MILSLSILVRTLRPYALIVSSLAILGYRLYRAGTVSSSSEDGEQPWQQDPTLLQLCLTVIQDVQAKVWERVFEYYPEGSSSKLLRLLLSLSFQLLQDFLGIMVLLGVLRWTYVVHHFSWNEWKLQWQDNIFEWAKANIPVVAKHLEKETDKMVPDFEKSFGKDLFKDNKLLKLPSQGQDAKALLAELSQLASKENEHWKTGKVSGAVYTSDETHIELMNQVYGLYSVANILHPGIWPRLNQCEAEIVAMTCEMLHHESSSTGGIGCTTSGGTESIMLAIKAHFVLYGKRRGIIHPELICGTTAHAAVDKACEVLGIRKVVIDCSKTHVLDPRKVKQHITSNTLMIYASAPCYPQGTVDPIEELGTLAQSYDIGLHVDSCLGGFVLPFAPAGHFPKFDFQVPGVTSMSADIHKFGYAPKGTSVVLYRDKELRHAMYFCYARWTGGMYATPTFAGSKPSALVGCAWAALVTIGREGYEERTRRILDASNLIAQGIRQSIPELRVLGDQRPSMIVCFGGSEQVDVYRVGDAMQTKGWSLNSLQHPASVHICVTQPLAPHAQSFLKDLKEAVAEIRKEDPSNSKKGTAGVYGMAGSIPDGPVNDLLRSYLDVSLQA